MVTTIAGTLMRNAQCQLATERIIPPAIGDRARPREPAAAHAATAFARCSGGKSTAMRERAGATTSAPPTPMIVRAPTSWGTVDESPAASDPTVKSMTPLRKVHVRL
jgi:hypothetical protein